MKIAHVSDLHLLSFSSFQAKDLLSKRFIGAANLIANRASLHTIEVVEKALYSIRSWGVDHLIVTGDLSNLGLTSEFRLARRLLQRFDSNPMHISVVPGNHDSYTHEVVRKRLFEQAFAHYQTSDLDRFTLPSGYPFVQLREQVAIVGINTTIASPPFFAIGKVDARQLRALDSLLEHPEVSSRFVIVMMHHPIWPYDDKQISPMRRLTNADDVLRICRAHKVDLVAHGHNHSYLNMTLPRLNSPGRLRICEPGSTSISRYEKPIYAGKYMVYHIDAGQLTRIETHTYESASGQFRRWRDYTY